MSLSNLVFFYRRRLRARRVQELLALVGIAVGVALLYSVQVSSTSLSGSVEQLTQGLFGRAQWQLVARGPDGFDQRTVRMLASNRDVRAAVPVIEVPASVTGPGGSASVTIFAAGGGLRGLGGDVARFETVYRGVRTAMLPRAVADAVGARFGGSVTLDAKGRAVPVSIGAIVDRADVGALSEITGVLLPFAYAQELTGLEGRVSRAYVAARPGREQAVEAFLRRVAAGHLDVRPVDFDAQVFAQAAAPNDQSTGLFAAISAFVGFLFAFNALLLVAGQRRELIAELRGLGLSRRTITRVLAMDALVLGAVASVLGLALGELLSRTVFPPRPGYLALAFPVGIGRVVDLRTIVVAIAGGLLASLLATFVPLLPTLWPRSAIRAAYVRGGSARASKRWAFGAGVMCLGVSMLVRITAPEMAALGIVTLIAALLLSLPWILDAALAAVDRTRAWMHSSAPLLAVGELRASGARSVAVAAIAGIALLGAVALEGSHRDLQRGLDQDVHELSAVTDIWVTAAGTANALATMPFHIDAAGRLRRAAGVRRVEVQRGAFLDLGDRRVWVMAPPRSAPEPVPAGQMLDGDPAQAMARLRRRGWVALSEALAQERHLSVGEAFTLNAPRPVRARVAAIISNLGWTPGTIVLNATDYARAWASSDASALRVTLAPGVSPAEGRALVQRALGPGSGLTVETAAEREQRQRETARQGLARLTQIAGLMLGAAALAMAAAMGAMVWQRRQRIAAVKLLGISTRRVWHALLIETAVLLIVGCTIGTLFGICGAQLLNRTLTTVTGFPVQSSLALPVAGAAYAVLALTAFAIAAAASYLAAQVPTREALLE
ncbi:MAG TPA: FtsX-like permease family protein [Conexibacter sp.]|nr:FtsX-like permease family protein [Conexibacter sp.]